MVDAKHTTKRRVLVTGSSRGIGRAIALDLARQGFDIVLHYRSDDQALASVRAEILAILAENASQHGGVQHDLSALKFDVADRETARTVIESDIEANGPYYGIICNAGITRDNAFPSITETDWDDVIHTNLSGFYNVVQPAIMPMIRNRQGGRIIAMSSVSGIMGNRGQVNYSASKAGLIGASKSLAIELGKRKITVNCVAPGLIDTDILDATAESEKHYQEIVKMIPAKRMGKPEEVAAVVRFLMSDDAAYVTKQVIAVDGGLA
ncbi:MAG: 3-ketoacyl-ACP reductase FabG2 [Pseudomonadales bacterium]|nr:3-ketoacyl-ACP reductase FabG2 [Pseudomonadales bacterium]